MWRKENTVIQVRSDYRFEDQDNCRNVDVHYIYEINNEELVIQIGMLKKQGDAQITEKELARDKM